MSKTPEEIAADEAAAVAAKAAEDKAAEDEKNKPKTFDVKVDGEIRQMTMEELVENASKAAGADSKFRDAAQMKEDAKKGVEIGAAFKKINSGSFDATDVRKLAELTGQDADEAVASYTAELKKGEGDGKDKKPAVDYSGGIKFENLPKDVQEYINEGRELRPSMKEKQIEDAQKKVDEMVEEEVAKDDFLGKIVIDAPDELKAGIKEVIYSSVRENVDKKILASRYTKEKFGTEMIRNSIQKARAEFKKLGISSKKAKQADRISILAELGPTGHLPAEVYSDETVERVDSTDPGYEDNAVKRLGQKLRQDAQKGA